MKRKEILAIVVLVGMWLSLLGGITSAERVTGENKWVVPQGYYGYPVPTMTIFDGRLVIVASENYNKGIHFSKTPINGDNKVISVPTGNISQIPLAELQLPTVDGAVWFYDETTWTANKTLGYRVTSNIVNFNDTLYLGTDEFGQVLTFNRTHWAFDSNTKNFNVTDMIVYNNTLFAVTLASPYLYQFNGTGWSVPVWFNATLGLYVSELSVYKGRLFIYNTVSQNMYFYNGVNMSKLPVPQFGLYPIPMAEYDGLLICANGNQIYTYDGVNWDIEFSLDASYRITSMYVYKDSLYIGTERLLPSIPDLIYIYDGANLTKTEIDAGEVLCFYAYGVASLYAGTDSKLYRYEFVPVTYAERINNWILTMVILGASCIVFGAITWNKGLEDIIAVSLGAGFWSVAFALYSFPDTYLYPFILIFLGLAIFIITLAVTSMQVAKTTDLKIKVKKEDLKYVAVVVLALFVIEYFTHIFSHTLLPTWSGI